MEGWDNSWKPESERLVTPEELEELRLGQRLILGAFAAELAIDAPDVDQPTLF